MSFKKIIEEEIKKHFLMENKNVVKIEVNLTDDGFRDFKRIATFKNLLYNNQLKELRSGKNVLMVNKNVWRRLERIVAHDSKNMEIKRI